MLAGLAGICASAHAATPITINTSVQYKIKNVNSGLVLGLSGASQAAGTKVVQWQDNGTSDHLWHFMPMGNGQYNIENMLTHQVLGVTNASTADGRSVSMTFGHRYDLI
jgi:arabinan endo-1,5-alpha-L-arabinosidase